MNVHSVAPVSLANAYTSPSSAPTNTTPSALTAGDDDIEPPVVAAQRGSPRAGPTNGLTPVCCASWPRCGHGSGGIVRDAVPERDEVGDAVSDGVAVCVDMPVGVAV